MMQGYNVWEHSRHYKKAVCSKAISTDQSLTNERKLKKIPLTSSVFEG